MVDGTPPAAGGSGRNDGASYCPHCGVAPGSNPVPVGLQPFLTALTPKKMVNKVTHVPLPHVYDDKLNAHMGLMNSDGWELINIFIEAIGIEERCIMIWGKRV